MLKELRMNKQAFLKWIEQETQEMRDRRRAAQSLKLQDNLEGWVESMTYVKGIVEVGHFDC